MNVVFDLAVNLAYTKLNTPLQQFRMKVVAGRFDLCYWSKGPPLRLRYIFFVSLKSKQHVLYTAPVYLKVKVGNDQEMAQ